MNYVRFEKTSHTVLLQGGKRGSKAVNYILCNMLYDAVLLFTMGLVRNPDVLRPTIKIIFSWQVLGKYLVADAFSKRCGSKLEQQLLG